jgi:hypothetical protein
VIDKPTPIPTYELAELLTALKPYQASAISKLIEKHGEEEAAKLWLSANGPTDTQKFGGSGTRDTKPFWDKFQEELRLVICSDEKYKEDREKLLSQAKPAAGYVVHGITALVATTLGLAPALLVPAVAIMLNVIGKVGVNAWCKCG